MNVTQGLPEEVEWVFLEQILTELGFPSKINDGMDNDMFQQ